MSTTARKPMTSAQTTTTRTTKTSTVPVPLSSHESTQHAFDLCVQRCFPDMSLLMHGAGDVLVPNADTATKVAELTTDYIAKLCMAAVDAHDILTDGAGGLLPPPAIPPKPVQALSYAEEQRQKQQQQQQRAAAAAIMSVSGTSAAATAAQLDTQNATNGGITFALGSNQKKRKIPGEEYWDDPLPMPKIKSLESKSNSASTTAATSSESSTTPPSWVGLNGVDFQQQSRTRKRHVSQAIGTQSFIFPICHDAILYQRVVRLQAAQREMAQVLEDVVVMECLQEEQEQLLAASAAAVDGNGGGPSSSSSRSPAATAAAAAVAATTTTTPMTATFEWPGLEGILPVHKYDVDSKKE